MHHTPMAIEGANVRTVLGEDGEMWFVARDVAAALGYSEPHKAVRRHCKSAKNQALGTLGGTQELKIINRADVVRLLARARVVGEDGMDRVIAMVDQSADIMRALHDFEVPDDLPDMYVYAIRESETGRVKLGISRDPELRLRQLQTGNSQSLELVAYRKADNRYQDEAAIHRLNAGAHVRGEWFDESATLDGQKGSLYLVEASA